MLKLIEHEVGSDRGREGKGRKVRGIDIGRRAENDLS